MESTGGLEFDEHDSLSGTHLKEEKSTILDQYQLEVCYEERIL